MTLNLLNPHPAGQGLTNLMANIKDLLLLRHQISSRKPSKNYQRLQPYQPNAPFNFWKPTRSFSCGGGETGGLEFPGPDQQELSVGLVPFHREPSRPRTSSLTVCLCGSSKRPCWRTSPFTWPVWSELEGFPPAGLLVAVCPGLRYRDWVLLPVRGCSLVIAWSNYEMKTARLRAVLIFRVEIPVQVLVIQCWVSADSRESLYFPTEQSHKHKKFAKPLKIWCIKSSAFNSKYSLDHCFPLIGFFNILLLLLHVFLCVTLQIKV